MRRTLLTLLCLPLSAIGLTACGSTAATAGFTGAKHEVAQTIADLQNDATAAEQKKICTNDLAASIVSKLGGSKGCEKAIKNQLTEVDNLETSVKSVQLAADGNSATAQVKSIHEGKTATSTVALIKEGAKWKIAGVPAS
jgi:hypothetical protein